ncbi:MAG: hypothetical protein AB7G62_01415 [Magnetospirillum sp.]
MASTPTNTTTTATDIANTCWTCEPVQSYVDLSQEFVDKLDVTLHTPMLILFSSLAGLWIVVSGVKLALHMTDKQRIIQDFVFISITGVLLGSQSNGLISFVYSSALSVMGGASASVFSIAGGAVSSSGYSGLAALAASAEQAMVTVFQTAQAIVQAGSLYKLHYYFYALILVLPYFLLAVAYASQIVVSIFRATMVGVFSPFLFMAFAFGWGRDMAKAGAKTLLASTLVLFASTAAVALCVYGATALQLDPTKLVDAEVAKFLKISNPKLLVILFLGWAGTALLAEGTSIANSIAQTALTNAAAGIMTAGVSGSALFGMKKAPAAAGLAGNAAAAVGAGLQMGQAAAGNPQAAAQVLVDKFNNINGGKGVQNPYRDTFNQPKDGGG